MARTTDDFALSPPLEFLRHVWRLNHALEQASKQMDRTLGLTAQQRFTLRCIGGFPGIAPGEIARTLHIDPGTVTATLKRLEAKGLVARRLDKADHRRFALTLTARGRSLDKPTPSTVEAAVEELLQNTSRADLARTVAVIDDLVETLTVARPVPAPRQRRNPAPPAGAAPRKR